MGGHEHAGLTGQPAADGDRRWLTSALILISGFMAAEVIVGVVAHSLALLSDAAHMLTDAGSIVLALTAMRLAARPARGDYTLGSSGRRSCRRRRTASPCWCWRRGWHMRRSGG